MHRNKAAPLLLAALLLGSPAPARGEAPADGRAVMARVDQRPRGADELVRATWRLVDKRGGERVRETRSWWQDARSREDGLHSKRLILFDAPASIQGTGFLVHGRSDPAQEDLRWVYLPAVRKVRRIAGVDRDKLFAGTDFTYEDLGERDVDEDTHALLRSEEIDGRLHHVVESRPRGESAWSRRVQWVDAERWVIRRAEFHDQAKRLAKILDARWREEDGIWFWHRLEMQNLRRGSRTIVEVEETEHDRGLADDLFHENTLRLGVP